MWKSFGSLISMSWKSLLDSDARLKFIMHRMKKHRTYVQIYIQTSLGRAEHIIV